MAQQRANTLVHCNQPDASCSCSAPSGAVLSYAPGEALCPSGACLAMRATSSTSAVNVVTAAMMFCRLGLVLKHRLHRSHCLQNAAESTQGDGRAEALMWRLALSDRVGGDTTNAVRSSDDNDVPAALVEAGAEDVRLQIRRVPVPLSSTASGWL